MPPQYQLVDLESREVVVSKLYLATSFWQRFRGLQFHPGLEPDEGLLLVRCRSVHTHWMRFPIDVAMLDRGGAVLAVHHEIRPWRMVAGPRETHAVLETAAGTLDQRLQPGRRVTVIDETKGTDAQCFIQG